MTFRPGSRLRSVLALAVISAGCSTELSGEDTIALAIIVAAMVAAPSLGGIEGELRRIATAIERLGDRR